MNVVENEPDLVTLSDGSDDLDHLPLSERVNLLLGEPKNDFKPRKFSPRKFPAPVHSISDSEESDSEKNVADLKTDSDLEEDHKLPDLNDFLSIPLKDAEFKLLNKPALALVNLSYSEDEFKEITIEKAKLVKRNKEQKKVKDAKKEEEKIWRMKIREEKKREKELAKALKASEKEVMKSKKPEECLKSMKIVIDDNIIYQDGSQVIFNILDENNVKYSIEQNHVKHSVIWFRNVASVAVENYQILKEEREELEDNLVLMIPNEELLHMLHASNQQNKDKNSGHITLPEYIANIKSLFPGMSITCVVVAFNKFIKTIKEDHGSDEMKTLAKRLSKTVSEEMIAEVQIQAFINFNFMESMTDFGSLLCRFTKAIAEAPQRKEKHHQKSLAFSWYADADSSCPAKIAKDGVGLIKLWKQQIQQFQNVGPEIAEAIVSRYPSPQLLVQAYKNCSSIKEAEKLLQDIVVRRNYGPLGTQRRIGPELSFKLYLFFTSKDGSQILQR